MTKVSRRLFLATTAISVAITALPVMASNTGSIMRPWQPEIDAMFEIFDTCDFSQTERCKILNLRPLNPELSDKAIRTVLYSMIATSVFKQNRVDQVLTVGRNLEARHGHDIWKQREYLDTVITGHNGKTLRELMTTGDHRDLQLVSRHTNKWY